MSNTGKEKKRTYDNKMYFTRLGRVIGQEVEKAIDPVIDKYVNEGVDLIYLEHEICQYVACRISRLILKEATANRRKDKEG